MLALPIIGFVVFAVYPQLWTFKWAFFNYDGIPSNTEFIGLDNFKKFFVLDFSYWRYWWQTIRYALIKVPVELSLALFLAVVINQKFIRCKGFFRAMFYAPVVVSGVVVSVIFTNLFGYFGVINDWLIKLSIMKEGYDWFSTTLGATAVLIISSTWNTFGINVLYFIAALNNVPKDCYESAYLDGANSCQVFFKITLPLITRVFRIILLLSILGTLGIGEFIITLTGGGPGGTTQTVNSYIVKAFVPGFAESSPAIGYGCALSVITTIIYSAIGILYHKFSSKQDCV